MADAVTTQVLENGARNLAILFTNISDGTGESAVKKVDAASSTYAGLSVGGATAPLMGTHLSIWRIDYNVSGMGLEMLWDATSAQVFQYLTGAQKEKMFPFGGITVPAITGATGSILFTTKGQVTGSGYTVTLWMKKNV